MTAETIAPIPFLDLQAQQSRIGPSLRARLDAVLAHGQYILGPEVAELEARLAAFCGAAHCVSVSSGTDALQIALMAEGIGRGDAVFLPAFTYTATAEVPLLLGATPVFVDVDPRTFQMDLAGLRARIADVKRAGKLTPRAVIGVDLFGQPADWPAIRAIAAEEKLFTLDDCAQSFGASLGGERLGRAADATATSFFPSKPLGAYGDGGALFTESAERAALYRSLRTHGEGTTRYEVLRTGMNGRLDTMQAAVLLAKLDVFESEIRAPRSHRPDLRPGTRRPGRNPRPRAGQHQRLGRVFDPAARPGHPRFRAGRAAGPADRQRRLLSRARCTSSPLMPAAMTGRPCRWPRAWAGASWPCRSTPISPTRRRCASRRRSAPPWPGRGDDAARRSVPGDQPF